MTSVTAAPDVVAPEIPLYGLLARFPDAQSTIDAAIELTRRGYRQVDGYTPLPVPELAAALGFHRTRMSLVVLIGGIIGLIGGFSLQWWISVVDYPLNIGGRPLNSWPAFMPVTFELTILSAALSAVLGMLALNGLPRPHHPLFAIPAFDHATTDGYFLCVEQIDAQFDPRGTRQLLFILHALEVWDVPNAP